MHERSNLLWEHIPKEQSKRLVLACVLPSEKCTCNNFEAADAYFSRELFLGVIQFRRIKRTEGLRVLVCTLKNRCLFVDIQDTLCDKYHEYLCVKNY